MNLLLSTDLQSQQHLKKGDLPTSAEGVTSAPPAQAANGPHGGEAELWLPQCHSHRSAPRSRDSAGLAHSRQCHLLSPGPRPIPPTGVPKQLPSSSITAPMQARPQKAAFFSLHAIFLFSHQALPSLHVGQTLSCWMIPTG